MKILIIGNDPHDIGGVANYTRPLALKFAELGHRVFYFYSGAWNGKYDWRFNPYLRITRGDFPFECAELVNSPNWTFNFGHSSLDLRAPATERIFAGYLDAVKPDVMHVHSRLGLPLSLIEIAAAWGIRVFNTTHVYGMLCQKRVMIDADGNLCEGPLDPMKCARCTGHADIGMLKFKERIKRTSAGFAVLLSNMKRIVRPNRGSRDEAKAGYVDLPSLEKTATSLRRRLTCAVELMNERIEKNLCVSSDVKNTLKRFGVREEKLLIQPIGSVIAGKQDINGRVLHSPIVIGNIGGVDYYKGTHVLIDAIGKIGSDGFVVRIFGKYDKGYVEKMMKGREGLPVEFSGRYSLEELPGILRRIDVMVLPSICNDTAPQTIFESHSAGIPIIASDIGGFPDFVQDEVNGYLFKPGDSGELASKIQTLLANPEKIRSFSSKIPPLKTIRENASELLSMYGECAECR